MEASASRLARLSTDDERLARALEESRISDAPGQPRGPPPTISPADAELWPIPDHPIPYHPRGARKQQHRHSVF